MPQKPIFKSTPIAAAIAAILCTAPAVHAQGEKFTLEEVLVTARKRTESVQDIPASIMAIGQEQLKAIGAQGIDDYSRFVPSLNVVSYGAGASVYVFRGATIDGGGYIAQSPSSVYLDEISITSTGAQPGVRMVDIARVEALAGPQGTLYGSDAQAGTLRIVTNKPVMDEFELVLDGTYRTMSEGDSSYDGSIVLNLPLIEDKLALRLVAFDAKDGGYIDNVYGKTPDTNITGNHYPADFGTLDNAKYVEKDHNEIEYSGWRAALTWQVNENWSATAAAIHQETNSGADNDYDTFVGDLETIAFFDDYRDDEYDIYALTIEGDLGFAQLVSATSYYERDIKQEFDITVYHHYWDAVYCQVLDNDPAYYYWQFPNPGGGTIYWAAYCMAPTADGDYLASYAYPNQQERFTQEIRLSSQGDTLDWLVGLYYEDSSNDWQTFYGINNTNDFQDSLAAEFYRWYDGSLSEDAAVPWYAESATDWEQKAVFGEVVWHVNDKTHVTLGGRYFDREHETNYFVENPNTRRAPDYVDGPSVQTGEETEFVPKIAIAYDWSDDTMVYALYTEGFKPGGTNRQRGEPFFPMTYEADKMINYEAGIRSTFADGTARANVTVFYMDWEDFQLELVDPSSTTDCPEDGPGSIAGVCGQPWQAGIQNAGDAHIMGLTLELDWAVNDRFVVGMNAEWLEAETDSNLDLNADGVFNVVKSSQLPITPDLSGAAWATYNWPVAAIGGNGYARLQWSYMDSTISKLEPLPEDNSNPEPQHTNDSYDIGDFTVGLQADTWEASLFVHNITDERAQFTSGTVKSWGAGSVAEGRAHVQSTYSNRPREYGLRVIKRW